MNQLISECNDFMKDCGSIYAFCGGYALELFTGAKTRTHSDIDITVFSENRKNIVDFILGKGWHVYAHLHSQNRLKRIASSDDVILLSCLYVWAIKPGCSFITIDQIEGEETYCHFEITDGEQKQFDFIDIIFNTREDAAFICDHEKKITRDLDKAILFHGNIPFLAPEVILFLISNPAYFESNYHRKKSNLDFESTLPFLSKDRTSWLISALEKAYPIR